MSKTSNARIGIYLSALLMMGIIGIASSLSSIAANFPGLNQTEITGLISVPSLVIVPVTLSAGKLMDHFSKKVILITGIVLFIIGGSTPYLLTNFNFILLFRGIFGAGVGLIQVLCAALVAENYEDAERDQVMGGMNSFQMLGSVAMSLIGGKLGAAGWNLVFLTHLIGIVSLIGAIIFIPGRKPAKRAKNDTEKVKFKLTFDSIMWIITMLVFFIGGQIFSNTVSFLITELTIGTAAEAGLTLSIFAAGGFLMGFAFPKVLGIFKNYTAAFAFFLLAFAYVIMAVSTSLMYIYFGAFLTGLAFSVAMPVIMVGASNSSAPDSVAMVIALVTGAQNIGATLSPYITSIFVSAISGSLNINTNQIALIFGAVLLFFAGVFFVFRGKNSKAIN